MARSYNSSPDPVHTIMVTWNALGYTRPAIESLFRYTTQEPYILTVVDNGSHDGTQEYLRSLNAVKPSACKEISIIENSENIGYGGAINQAHATKGTEYVCVSNNDVLFSPGWLGKMLNVMNDDPELGILGPLRPLPWCEHPYQPRSTDDVLREVPAGLDPEAELRAYCQNDYETFVEDLLKMNNFGTRYLTGPPIHVVTCCALGRSSIIDEVGGLADPAFKTFGSEDTDLSWRISTAGYRIGVTSKAYVHHAKHKSATYNNLDRNEHCRINNHVFHEKWREVIRKFIQDEVDAGVDVGSKFASEDDYNYWFLRRLRENIGSRQLFDGVKRLKLQERKDA